MTRTPPATRARIIALKREGLSNSVVGERLGVHPGTVGKVP